MLNSRLPVHFSVATLFNFRWQYTIRKWSKVFFHFLIIFHIYDYIVDATSFTMYIQILIKKTHLAIFSFGMYFFPYGII